MKQHFFKKFGLMFVFPLALLCFFACKKDILTPNNISSGNSLGEKGSTNAVSAQEAQQWFESQNFADAKSVDLQPQWNKAVSYGDKMEIPILFKGMSKRMSLTRRDTNHFSKSRMVVYKRGENKYDAYILHFVPSNSFDKDVNTINVVNYEKKKFDGKVFIAGLDNQISGVYNVVEGKRGKFAKIKTQRAGEANFRGLECYDVCWQVCGQRTIFSGGVFTVVWGCETICDYNICIYVDDDDPCISPNPPSWCGGGGDPCNEPLPPPSCSSGDPCLGPNPPLYCNGSDDGDPCLGPNPPPSCNECICKNQSETRASGSLIFDFDGSEFMVNVEVGLTGKDCKTGNATCSNNFYPFPLSTAAVSVPINNVELWEKAPLANTINCGFTAKYWSRGIITATPQGSEPKSSSWDSKPSFTID